MKKKLIALLLACVMLFALSACGGGGGEGGGGGDDEIYTVVMAFPTWVGAPADTKMVQDAINEITREKIGVEVEFQIYDIGSYTQSLTLALAGGEQVDICSAMSVGYATLANQGYLLDMDENDLLKTYGKGIIDAVGQEFIDAARYGGKQLGLPGNKDMAQGRGCVAIQTKYLEGIGYQFPAGDEEIIRITEAELNDILDQIHAAYPNIDLIRPATGPMQYSTADYLGNSPFGVLMDYGKGSTVVDFFETDEYYDYCKMVYDWNQKGYISKDAATDTTSVTELAKADVLVAYTTGGKPGIKSQETLQNNCDMTIFQTKEDFVSSTGVAGMPWCITVNTDNAVATMKLLNEFYTNKELANLLAYGIEGTHYTLTANGQYSPDGCTNPGGFSTLMFLSPNEYLLYVPETDDPQLWQQMKDFNSNAEQSIASGFLFDATGVSTELTAVQNVYNEYQQQLEYGFLDPDTGIPEMVNKMMNAGLQTIIDAKQAQLDEWLAAKG